MIKIDLDPFVSGDDLDVSLRFNDRKGHPINVAGDRLYLTLKDDIKKANAEAIMSFTYDIPDDNFTRVGIVSLTIDRSVTNIISGSYHYDFRWKQIASGAGKVFTKQIGMVVVMQPVTQLNAGV